MVVVAAYHQSFKELLSSSFIEPLYQRRLQRSLLLGYSFRRLASSFTTQVRRHPSSIRATKLLALFNTFNIIKRKD